MDSPVATRPDYEEASDLSKLCLPQEYKDSNRRLAWANSICLLFLVIGCLGLKAPPVTVKPLTPVVEFTTVELPPPEEPPPPPTPSETQPEPEPSADVLPEQPVVATVVAADPAAAAFAVPVQGPVVLAPAAHLAAPPPQNLKPPPSNKPVALQSSEEDWSGGSGQIDYPGMARRNRYQGTVSLEITFDANGAVQTVKVLKTSGYSILDNAAIEKVQKSLRLKVPPGEVRVYTKDFNFSLR